MITTTPEKTLQKPAYQAYKILQFGFTAAPILAGLDKFFNLLTDWHAYLAPVVQKIIPASVFMPVVGVIETAAGILVAVKPKIAAPIVGVWLLGIIVNLLLTGHYFDIALRDLGLSLGAFALGRLAVEFAD